MITRVAPSPTGYMHIGNLRTALLNYLMARANNGIFILRIDDTDQDRNQPQYIDYIYDQMKYFGLDYDITFKQSDKLDRYKYIAQKIGTLTDNGYELNMNGYNMIILRNNGFPTYNFSSILDDYDSSVTHIIRGVDHIANLDKQKFIWDKICQVDNNKTFPDVIHAGLLFDKGKKFSKRDGTTADFDIFDKDAILNWLVKFGWSHSDPNFDRDYPILSMQQMIAVFNDGNISNRNCNVDRNKLNFLDKKFKWAKK